MLKVDAQPFYLIRNGYFPLSFQLAATVQGRVSSIFGVQLGCGVLHLIVLSFVDKCYEAQDFNLISPTQQRPWCFSAYNTLNIGLSNSLSYISVTIKCTLYRQFPPG